MVKRTLGVLIAVATVAVIVLAVVGRDGFRSLLADEARPACEPAAVSSEQVSLPDSTAVRAAAEE